MKMRRKPEFDRFNSGLRLRVESLMKDNEYDTQDIVNMIRSECSRNWKYLIDKVNKLERELEELKKKPNED